MADRSERVPKETTGRNLRGYGLQSCTTMMKAILSVAAV